jgi:DNA-binding NtrC family response regulator
MGSRAAGPVEEGSTNAVIASPNANFRKKLVDGYRQLSCVAEEVHGGAEALAMLESGDWGALLLDRWLPDLDVPELLTIVKKLHPQVEVVVFDSGTGTTLTDPSAVDLPPLRQLIDSLTGVSQVPELVEARDAPRVVAPAPAPHRHEPVDEVPAPRSQSRVAARAVEPLPDMIGSGPAMQQVYRLARLVAPRTTTVLVTGETGTGKELVARGIHLLSRRDKQPFITVNCAAIPETLIEAELFGYARGAFTGAFQSRLGRVHAAHGGTLFLDEVGDLPLSMQAKLLRFLQEGEVQRLGGTDTVRVDVRVIAATNADLPHKVKEKVFREDLYYRIAAFPIFLTPLRNRSEDILALAEAILQDLCREAQCAAKSISRQALKELQEFSWPGNVRELRHVMERAFILSEDHAVILPEHIALPQDDSA